MGQALTSKYIASAPEGRLRPLCCNPSFLQVAGNASVGSVRGLLRRTLPVSHLIFQARTR